MPFTLFAFATIGLTLIIVHGTIFENLRSFVAAEAKRIQRHREKKDLPARFSFFVTLDKILTCTQCAGFWSGLFCGLFLISHESVAIDWTSGANLFNRLFMLFCCGTAGSFLALLGNTLCDFLFFAKEYFFQNLPQHQQSSQEESQERADTFSPND